MKKFTKTITIVVCAALGLFLCSFSNPPALEDYLNYLQKSFVDHYDADQEQSVIKRYELNVTNTGFCRYKRFYQSGKTEYFSFKFSKFKEMDYLGSTQKGKLILRTKDEDVIVQTYNDRAGDVDSMASALVIPLKNIEADELNKIKSVIAKVGAGFK